MRSGQWGRAAHGEQTSSEGQITDENSAVLKYRLQAGWGGGHGRSCPEAP